MALFVSLYLSRLCSMASATGLRTTIATQPSYRYVQGSVLLALTLQPPGAILSFFLFKLLKLSVSPWIAASGLCLNIEHVFYEYLYAMGDSSSASLCESITALFTLAGLLVSFPDRSTAQGPEALQPYRLLIATGIPMLVGLTVSFEPPDRFRPKLNATLLKSVPISMLQTALYPALALLFRNVFRSEASCVSLFAGLALCELCRAPFRRSSREARPMNRALLTVCALSLLCALPFMTGRLAPDSAILLQIPRVCAALILSSVCAFCLYGNVGNRRE